MFRIVVTVHDVEHFGEDRSASCLTRWCYGLPHQLITHNSISKDELVNKAKVPSAKITKIPHGNYLHVIDQPITKSVAREQLSLPENGNILLFFGQIKAVKGLDLLLRALPLVLQKHPNTYLLISGKTWKTNFTEYENIIDQLNIRDHCITYIDYIPNEEVPYFYGACDLVILPYRRIYQSGVLLMAMSYGKPVVASDLTGMTEIITDGETGLLFRSGDADDLADCLARNLANEEMLEKIAVNGRELMKTQFNWPDIGRKTLEVYRGL